MLDIEGICKALEGRVRGKPVAITFFEGEIPDTYNGIREEPCVIIHQAMDEGRRAYFSREYNDCTHGTFLMGLDEGNQLMQTGRILTDFIPVYTSEAAKRVNSGQFRLPEGMINGIGAAPLDNVPPGMEIKWIVVVCNPEEATFIAAARSVKDGVMPSTAAGNSFCTDAFATPWFENNVVITTGDNGARINNKIKPDELFVIIPAQYANNLVELLGNQPDVLGLYEATRPAHSDYWKKKAAREEMRAQRRQGYENDKAIKKHNLKISMDWDQDAIEFITKAPKFVQKFAAGRVEDFALEHGYDRISLDVVHMQMEKAGTRKSMGIEEQGELKKKGFWRKLFKR